MQAHGNKATAGHSLKPCEAGPVIVDGSLFQQKAQSLVATTKLHLWRYAGAQ